MKSRPGWRGEALLEPSSVRGFQARPADPAVGDGELQHAGEILRIHLNVEAALAAGEEDGIEEQRGLVNDSGQDVFVP